MTPAQTSFYWRLWGRVCKANGWTGTRIKLGTDPKSDLHRQVIETACELARNEHRAIELDDLRHGAHKLAFGSILSSKAIRTNPMFDRIKTVFLKLINPDDLGATVEQLNPDHAERRRLEYQIERLAPEAYTADICRDIYGTTNLDHLDLVQLRHLAMTLRQRNKRRHEPIAEAVVNDNCPF